MLRRPEVTGTAYADPGRVLAEAHATCGAAFLRYRCVRKVLAGGMGDIIHCRMLRPQPPKEGE